MRHQLKFRILVTTLAIFLITGVVSPQSARADDSNTVAKSDVDPYEKYNRAIYKFNSKLDKYILKPLAKGYTKITPDPVERGVSNFFSNLGEPQTAINSILQGKFDKAGISTGRFVLNTTVGVLGFFDVASNLDIPKQREDFGQTLAAWGVPSGPYFVLPIFGPRTLRHSAGMIPDAFMDPVYYVEDDTTRLALTGLDLVQTRTKFFGVDDLLELQLDPYIFARESYLQQRQAALADAKASEAAGADEFDDEFDDEIELEN